MSAQVFAFGVLLIASAAVAVAWLVGEARERARRDDAGRSTRERGADA